MTDQITYGFARKRDVPVRGGRPKVCPKCEHWFSAQPRFRVCPGCRRNDKLTLTATHGGQVKGESSQVTAARISAWCRQNPETHTEARLWDKRVDAGMSEQDAWRAQLAKVEARLPVIPLWRQLALEAAAAEVSPKPSNRGMLACVPDCTCDPCRATRPAEYRGVAA